MKILVFTEEIIQHIPIFAVPSDQVKIKRVIHFFFSKVANFTPQERHLLHSKKDCHLTASAPAQVLVSVNMTF
jgi:hypothetical protein